MTILLAGYASMAGAQTDGTRRSQASVHSPQVDSAVWSADRPPKLQSRTPVHRSTPGATTATSGPTRSSQGWTKPKTMANTSEHLNWRAPHDRSQELPRRLRPAEVRAINKPVVTKNHGERSPRTQVVLANHLEDIDRTAVVSVHKHQTASAAPGPDEVRARHRASADVRAFQDRTPAARTMTLNLPNDPLVQANTQRFDNPAVTPFPGSDPDPQEPNLDFFGNAPTLEADDQTGEPPVDLDRLIRESASNANAPNEASPPNDLPQILPSPIDNNDLLDAFDDEERPEFAVERDADTDDNQVGSITSDQLSSFSNQDCDSLFASCRDEFARLAVRQQTNMSIDITPSIQPRELDMARVDEIREEKLAKAPSRTWRDRQGTVLAEGRLTDYRHGKIYVRTLNGTLREFLPPLISDEDWCFVTSWWELPPECRFDDEPFQMRDFRLTTFTWTSPATCHKPLYFEEVQLERYGHTTGPLVQPFLSGAHFFGSALTLPFQVGLNPPNECQYTLGYYRPGDCAPWLVHGYPITTRGVTWQGLALGAAISLLP